MLLLLGGFLLLMLVGLPVAIAMAVSSLVYILVTGITPDVTLAQRMIAGVESFPLLAVPFFILAGNLMNIAGVTGRIYNFAVALVGWMRGGLGHVNIIGSVIFSGMSGTAIADAAGLGTIEIKAMKDHGYSDRVRRRRDRGLRHARPDHPAVAAVRDLRHDGERLDRRAVPRRRHPRRGHDVADDGDRRLLRAQERLGQRRAVLLAAARLGAPSRSSSFWHSRWWSGSWSSAGLSVNMAVGIGLVALLALDWYFDFSAVMALMAPVILIGGMTLGWFTPTEAAVAAVIWSLFLGLVRYRSMTLQTVAKATFDTIETTASVLFIVTAASIFAWLLTVSQAAQIADRLRCSAITQNKWVFLLLANILILFVGCFIDTIAAITILVPILLPIVLKLGIDPDPFRPDHDAEPDDRPAASAARHGAVRARARGEAVGRAHDDGDPAVAGAAAAGARRHHLHPGTDALAA